MEMCSEGVVPIQKEDKLSVMQCLKSELECKQMEGIFGSLMYAQTFTRSDISSAVEMLGRY